MKVRLSELFISCHKYQETVPLSMFSYFYGKMGAGKSSIARLIDYCLGGDLELTPALQSEFVGATLTLQVDGNEVTLERQRNTDQIRAHWTKAGELFDTAVPARVPAERSCRDSNRGAVDLFFYLGAWPTQGAPQQAQRRLRLGRLSLRDLLWYCYSTRTPLIVSSSISMQLPIRSSVIRVGTCSVSSSAFTRSVLANWRVNSNTSGPHERD